jgi:phage terminase Nu1 subunit (DNA packaging protein)
LQVVVNARKKQCEMLEENGENCLTKIITLSDLSSLVVMGERQLQRLVKDGVIPVAKDKNGQPMRGKFVLGEAVPHFVENMRDSLVTHDPAKKALAVDRARKMKIEADSAQLDLEEKRGELVRTAEIEFQVYQLIRNVRDGVRGVPSKVMHKLVGVRDPMAARKIVTQAIDATLHRVADGEIVDVKRWRKANRTYLKEQGFDHATAAGMIDQKEQQLRRLQKHRTQHNARKSV